MTSATRPDQSSPAVGPPTAAVVDHTRTSGEEPGRVRRQLHATIPGCWGALAFACLSFTPSLLPRDGLIQGIVTGVTAAIGYGLGVLVASIWRAFADRGPRPPRPGSWRVLAISAIVLFAVFFALGQYWQSQIRSLMEVTEYSVPLAIASPLIAAVFFALLILVGRGLRGLYRWTVRKLDRLIGRRAAHRPGLDPRRRPHLPGHHWSAPRRPGQRRRQGVLRARHHDRGGREPARQQPAVRRTRLRRPVGLAGPSGPQVHRQGADRVGHREHRPRSRDGAHPGVRRPEHGRRHRGTSRPRPSTTSSAPAASSEPTWSCSPPPAAAGWTRP